MFYTDMRKQNLRYRGPQNVFSLKEFDSTIRDIGLILFRLLLTHAIWRVMVNKKLSTSHMVCFLF